MPAQAVVCDTSPIRYLVQIGVPDLLGTLYGRVVVPESVATELNQPRTPEPVKQWILTPPNWLEIVPTANQYDLPMLPNLDVGESDAILLAVELKADLVIVDEREGVEEATRLGLRVTGTRGAERDLLDLSIVLRRLRATNFRVSPALLDRLLADDARRKRKLE